MFGYIRTYTPELKVKEYDIYKAVYCSLCKELGHHFGLFARFTLSYDFTFLALVRLSIQKEDSDFKQTRCTFNPAKKCKRCTNHTDVFEYVCGVAMITVFYKLKDNIKDESFWKKIGAYLLYPLAYKEYTKAKRKWPEMDRIAQNMYQEQLLLEKEQCASLDRAAHPSAFALGQIFCSGIQDETQRRILERMGYCIGRWVYLMDAIDDYEDDKKNKGYNPFVIKSQTVKMDDIKKYAEEMLNLSAGEAVSAFELLTVCQYGNIIKNILYEGLAQKQTEIINGKVV